MLRMPPELLSQDAVDEMPWSTANLLDAVDEIPRTCWTALNGACPSSRLIQMATFKLVTGRLNLPVSFSVSGTFETVHKHLQRIFRNLQESWLRNLDSGSWAKFQVVNYKFFILWSYSQKAIFNKNLWYTFRSQLGSSIEKLNWDAHKTEKFSRLETRWKLLVETPNSNSAKKLSIEAPSEAVRLQVRLQVLLQFPNSKESPGVSKSNSLRRHLF